MNATRDGFVKGGLLAGVDTDVGKFKNHESSSECCSRKGLTLAANFIQQGPACLYSTRLR
jgi:hypothetical protein